MSYSFKNKLQDDAESSDTFINKAVLTPASYTRTVYYKYNKIPVFYHLPSHIMYICKTFPLKSMRLMVKVFWTIKIGVKGGVLISSTLLFSFVLLYY